MGDHRASIKIEFTMHGVTSNADLWINWWDGAADDLPSSVRKFFADAERASMNRYHDARDREHKRTRERRQALLESARAKMTDEEWQAINAEKD